MKLTQGGFQVPGGFIVKASGFDEFAMKCNLFEEIEKVDGDIDEKRNAIVSIFNNNPIPEDLKRAIGEQLKDIKGSELLPNPLLAVRSSGVTEDLEEASFAGMNDTILNVATEVEAVCEAVKKCWLSLYGKRSIIYRMEHGFPAYNTSIAVVVQVMIPSESSGVIFTADPQSGSRGQISLDGIQGLGEALVSGAVNTDHWTIRKSYKKRKMFIEEESVGKQEFKLWSNYPNPGTTKIMLAEEEQTKVSFTKEQVFEVAEVASSIEKYYMKPMDIEFCFYKDHLFIVQARPITNLFAVPDFLNPLKNTNEAEWNSYICFNNLQMLTDPLSPCFASVFRNILGVSEKYFCDIGGFMYMNLKAIGYLKPARTNAPKIISKVIEKEVGLCLDEFFTDDFKYDLSKRTLTII